ncbi:MAG: hypothetical protein ABIN79_09965 [Marmoricola sp.]
MGLSDLLARVAATCAHVLVVEAPGAFGARVALERELDRVGWCAAASIADADVLAVVGEPGPELSAVVDHAWAQISEPRVRLAVGAGTDVAAAIAAARAELAQVDGPRAEAASRARFTPSAQDEPMDHGDMDHGDMDHGDKDHGSMSPDGIPLAEGAQDRDGLEMDELHLPLGPVLQHWPAGVVLRLRLHGDVVAGAEVTRLDAGSSVPADDDSTRAARLLDAAASVLMLAGLLAEAATTRRLRDQCLDAESVRPAELERLRSRLRRHRVLRWSLSGLAVPGARDLDDRVQVLIDQAGVALAGESSEPSLLDLNALPDLVRGQELAAVRLVVAALLPDLHTSTEEVRA